MSISTEIDRAIKGFYCISVFVDNKSSTVTPLTEIGVAIWRHYATLI